MFNWKFNNNCPPNWIDWLQENPGDFLITTGAVGTAIGTVWLGLATWKMVNSNVKIANSQQYGAFYVDLLMVMSDIEDLIKGYVDGLQDTSKAGFLPNRVVQMEEILTYRRISTESAFKLTIFPNSKVNPMAFQWFRGFGNIVEILNRMYDENKRDKSGNYTISDADRLDVIAQISELLEELKSQQVKMQETMASELRIQ